MYSVYFIHQGMEGGKGRKLVVGHPKHTKSRSRALKLAKHPMQKSIKGNDVDFPAILDMELVCSCPF